MVMEAAGTLRVLALASGCALVLSACATATVDPERMEVLRLNADAMHAYADGDTAEALTLYRRIVELDPDRPTAWYRIGNLQAETGELREAAAAYEETLARDPDFHQARHNLGLVLIRHGVEELDEARRQAPDEKRIHRTDVYLSCLLSTVVRNPDLEIPCPELP